VGIDFQKTAFSDLLVPGVCALDEQGENLEISLLLVNQGFESRSVIFPGTHLQREKDTVGEIFNCDDEAQNCQIEKVNIQKPSGLDADFPEIAVAQGVQSGLRAGVNLEPENLSFHYSGGKDRHEKEDEILLMILMDHSGSLTGEDPHTGAIDPNAATDFDENRIGFFQQLVRNLPDNISLSLVWFNGSRPTIEEAYATPTKNKSIINDGLDKLNRDATGQTPLAGTLAEVKESIIDGNQSYIPVVLLFTDGVEAGDSSTGGFDLAKATDLYVSEQIPVIILELQPQKNSEYYLPTGRNPELVKLACRTGGEYLALERAEEFTNGLSNLEATVRSRIPGAWKLTVSSTLSENLFDLDEYFLSLDLSVTLGGITRTASLTKSRNENEAFNDARLWLQKK